MSVDSRPPREPSMLDVAKRAGVSHQTVSRVLNDHPNVREDTRRRVTEAIAELGYRPNHAARALVTGRYRTIGVVAPRTTLFGPVSMLAAFEERAAAAGFTVSVGRVRSFDEATIADAVARHMEQRVAGIVVIAPVASAVQALEVVRPGVPLVALDVEPGFGGSTVIVDQVEGARIATRHLLDAGHPTVWHVSGPAGEFDASGRVRGWEEALRGAGADVPPVVHADWTSAAGYRAGQFLGRMPEVTAVFTANDSLALGLLCALHELGRSVPGDVSVVGFDDVPEAAYFTPPLTTIRQDFEEVARRSLQVLLQELETGPGTGSAQIVRPELVTRASVGPPRG